jgi:hypothetical protein
MLYFWSEILPQGREGKALILTTDRNWKTCSFSHPVTQAEPKLAMKETVPKQLGLTSWDADVQLATVATKRIDGDGRREQGKA